MATTTLDQLNYLGGEVKTLKQEVSLLRSLFLGLFIEEDKDGEYKPEFIKEIQKAMQEPAEYTFKDVKTFLNQLKSV
jgi:hypothetical protein